MSLGGMGAGPEEGRCIPQDPACGPHFASNPLLGRKDCQSLVVDLWRPLERRFRADGAFALLGRQRGASGVRAEALEGFSRSLWGLAPLRAGGGGDDLPWDLVRSVLLQGTGAGGWGPMADHDHRIVETVAIALSLVWARDTLWEPLSPQKRAQVLDWILQVNRVRVIENNWLWFRILANTALRELGQEYNPAIMQADFALVDRMWHGEAGYSDGPDEHRDYYVPMGMHYYGLLYAQIAERHDPERAELLRSRARSFAGDFAAWFARDGAAPAFGRSLHYRFSQAAFWSALVYAGVEVLPWDVVRGIICRHLRHWISRPVFTEDGLLSVGYGYDQPQLAEGYASSSSPYWGLKTFLVLAVQESHPFWACDEAPLPEMPEASPQKGMGMIATRPLQGRDVVLLSTSRSRRGWLKHNESKYHKFAYSARFGFSLSLGHSSLTLLAPDSALALSDDEGRHWRVREESLEVRFESGELVALWRPWPDVSIESRLAPDGDGHRRIHFISTLRDLHTFEGAFCVPRDADGRLESRTGPGVAAVSSAGWESSITDPERLRQGVMVETEPGTNLLWPLAALPGLEAFLPAGRHTLRCAVYGSPPDQLRDRLPLRAGFCRSVFPATQLDETSRRS